MADSNRGVFWLFDNDKSSGIDINGQSSTGIWGDGSSERQNFAAELESRKTRNS